MKDQILFDLGNSLHAHAPAPSTATACGSSTVPNMQDTASPAYCHPTPQPLRPELPTPQKRSGVPVYVMLPLDTVRFLTCYQVEFTKVGL